MGQFTSKQWNEMTEVNKAMEETEREHQKDKQSSGGKKSSFTSRVKTRILRSDPRSASDDVTRTPIAVDHGAGQCETPVRTMTLIDPRSPGCVLGGDNVFQRTPILVMEKEEGSEVRTPARGSSIPPFSLPDTPCEDTPVSDSPLIIKSQTMKTSTPTTVPLNYKTGQPSNLLQGRLREAAEAAMKDQDMMISAPAEGDFTEQSDQSKDFTEEKNETRDEPSESTDLIDDNNQSSLII